MCEWISFTDVEGREWMVDEEHGLVVDELLCLESLSDCHRSFLKLEREHPEELRSFIDAVHIIQDLLALRIVRRHYPKGWPRKGEEQ